MTDVVQEEIRPRKPGLLRRIFWWLWVILLTALLVLGLVFAAPWKVITLIAIFLAAGTILPRIYRKWFWLGVGLLVLAIIVWIFLPDDNKGWKPYQFDKELAQLQARYAVPDSENAAIIYNKILADWKQKETNEPNLLYDKLDFARHNFWLAKDQPEITAYIHYYQNTIEQLLQTANIQKCYFPINATFASTGHLSAFRQWSRLLVAAGNNDIAEVNTNGALEKYHAVIQLGQHISQQPELADKLVGMSCEALGLGAINNFVALGDANEFYLSKLEQVASSIKHDWNSDLYDFISLEKLTLKNMLCGGFYQVNNNGKTRLSHDFYAGMREEIKKQLDSGTVGDPKTIYNMQKIIHPTYWLKIYMRAFVIEAWFYVPATPEELNEIININFDKNYAMTKPDFDWSKKPSEDYYGLITQSVRCGLNIQKQIAILVKIDETLYFNTHEIYLRKSAEQKGTLLIIALRRYKNAHGHWPGKLEDINNLVPQEMLVDPINGDSFVYKRTEDNFTLYSKGKNGVDDNGKQKEFTCPDINNVLNKGCDDLLIWPPKSKVSKQQEKKTNE